MAVRDIALAVQYLLDEPLKQRRTPALGNTVIKAIFDTIKRALLQDESVHIEGFGTFKIVKRKPHPTPRNYLTLGVVAPAGSLQHYEPRRYVVFQPAIPFLAMLNLPSDGHEPTYEERRSQSRWQRPTEPQS